MITTGQTSDVAVKNKASILLGTELQGFSASLTAGYDGSFSNSVTNTATLGTDVEASLIIPTCYQSHCIKTLTVQPYLLQATAESAPWIPTAYNSQLPWAMQWKIVSYTTVGGRKSGVSPLPDQGSGIVVGGHGGTAQGSEDASVGGSYSVGGGKMAWRKDHGKPEPIPMKAAEFNPALGASVKLNGYTWSSASAKGGWTRHGKVWTFKSNKSADGDVVVLKLDFGSHTWDFALSKTDLSPFFGPSEGRTHLKLSVNDKYEFYFDCDHKVKSQWDLQDAATPSDGLTLSRYNGWFDKSGTGATLLEGDLPINLEYFGDMSFSVNGHQVNVPLISRKDYTKALAEGGELIYNKGGLKVTVDFGKKTWSAHFNKKAFHPLLSPRGGAATIQVKVGGEPKYTAKHAILNYTSQLD